MKDTRIQAKKEKNMLISDTFKLCMNGSYGNLISSTSWLYDPIAAMKITINGQLYLTMLAERFLDVGFKIESINTDGITTFVQKNKVDLYNQICKDWEKETNLELEYAYYYSVFRRNVNCYFAWYADDKGNPLYKNDKPYIKEKGDFLTEPVLGKGYDMPIVSKALKQYFIDNTPIDVFIRNHDNIYDFCKAQRIGGEYQAFWQGLPQQKMNRYYVTSNLNSGYITKRHKQSGKEISILKGFPVQLFNKYEQKEMKDYKIHYGYYISETRKILEEIDSKQLNLF